MRQRPVALALLLLLAAGCSRPAPETRPPDTPPPAAGQPPEQKEPTGPPPTTPSPLQRYLFEPGQPVGQPGIFFLNLATGAVEGWTVEGDTYAFFQYSSSPDNRWVTARGQNEGYLADRKTGRVFTLDQQEWVAAAGGDRVLLSRANPGGPAQSRLADAELKTVAEFPFSPQAALFSPDGQWLLLTGDSGLYRVGRTGQSQKLLDLPGDLLSVAIDMAPGGAEARVSVGLPDGKSRLLRIDWQGQLLADKLLTQAWSPILSPDGSAVAWEESLAGGLVQAITVADFATLTPRFRLVGARATLCTGDLGRPYEAWLADSSGLVIQAGILNPATGEVTAFPAGADPEPAPHRADLFALGRTRVVDAAGKLVAEAKLNPDPQWASAGHLEPWGTRSDELRFTLPHLGHGGRCGYQPDLPLKLERPPFPAEPLLVVGLPANDCVNLRRRPGKAENPITCLPGGSRLKAVVPVPVEQGEKVHEVPNGFFADDDWWVHVRTEAGEQGWVAFRAGQLTWAP